MENKEIIRKVAMYQQNGMFHELTCGNDSQHLPLQAKEIDGKVLLVCLECDYTQEYIPKHILI